MCISDGRPMMRDRRVGSGNLQITDLHAEDAGVYLCIAESPESDKPARVNVTLVVHGKYYRCQIT